MARYVEASLDADTSRVPEPLTTADHWVMRQLSDATNRIGSLLDAYRYSDASDLMYHTIWDDVADWYLEASKDKAGQGMLAWVLETCLKIAHPFAPFVTETIWTTLKWDKELLIASRWPEDVKYSAIAAAEFEQVQELVIETRYVASELEGKRQTLLYQNDTLIEENQSLIARLAKLEMVAHADQPFGLRLAVPNREAWLAVDEDTLYEHQTKIELRLVDVRAMIQKLELRLSNQGYIDSAPEKIIAETRDQLRDQQALELKLVSELDVLADR